MRKSGSWLALWAAVGVGVFNGNAGAEGMAGDGVARADRYFGAAAAPSFPVAEQQPCRDRYPERRAFFGATHVHTALSGDANAFGVTAGPDAAYAFARGEPIGLPPIDADGNAARTQQLARPLDFAAVTDHAEFLGEVVRCTTPGNPGYDSKTCAVFRGEDLAGWPEEMSQLARLYALVGRGNAAGRDESICGEGGLKCLEAMAGPWRQIQQAAEQWDDHGADCEFTTFVAYEYSLAVDANNLHRNVIFRNAVVPRSPVGAREARTPAALWRSLKRDCLDAGTGCDVIAIPHNSNWSAGTMFHSEYPGADTPQEHAKLARLRRDLEPLVEIMQVKGDSECRNGFKGVVGGPDELCDFEKLRAPSQPFEDCEQGTGKGGMQLRGCISRLSFARYGLIEGLKEQERIGINPLKFGIIAASDSHNATGGAVAEDRFEGSAGQDANPYARLQGEVKFGDVATSSPVRTNPGGLAGVWAEENSRDALFDAMKRRETFGTSGPRIQPRFFGGWDLPEDMCTRADFAATGYRRGVPMGGDLRTAKRGDAPVFALDALRDPSDDGAPLQRIQVIKGWVDDDGNMRQDIYDVAGSADNGAGVDVHTCERTGEGHARLCSVWRDPDFDRKRDAVYYARVVENPSCRWSTHECNRLPADRRPPSCSDPDIPKVIQERAWTSPIWYTAGK